MRRRWNSSRHTMGVVGGGIVYGGSGLQGGCPACRHGVLSTDGGVMVVEVAAQTRTARKVAGRTPW